MSSKISLDYEAIKPALETSRTCMQGFKDIITRTVRTLQDISDGPTGGDVSVDAIITSLEPRIPLISQCIEHEEELDMILKRKHEDIAELNADTKSEVGNLLGL